MQAGHRPVGVRQRLADGAPRGGLDDLRQVAEACRGGRQFDRATVGPLEVGDDPHERRLAAAVRADERDALAIARHCSRAPAAKDWPGGQGNTLSANAAFSFDAPLNQARSVAPALLDGELHPGDGHRSPTSDRSLEDGRSRRLSADRRSRESGPQPAQADDQMKRNRWSLQRFACPALAVLGLAAIVAAWTIYDDGRVVVRRQVVEVPGLPPALDGFTFLQISDLHGARFGPKQRRLLDAVAGLRYDAVAITGDMLQHHDDDAEPLFELLAGLGRERPIFYAAGDAEPPLFDSSTGERTPLGRALEGAGVTLLDRPRGIERGGARIWVAEAPERLAMGPAPAMAGVRLADGAKGGGLGARQAAYRATIAAAIAEVGPTETIVGVTHHPLTRARLEAEWHWSLPRYRLILAGHYHGGQLRLLLVGALYIPEPTLPRGTLPPREIVSGLGTWGGTRQYVSRGLGASNRVPALGFRLFNSPEVNLITLVPADDASR
jgi:uncharacterized protein